jgi:hypothetical protein
MTSQLSHEGQIGMTPQKAKGDQFENLFKYKLFIVAYSLN